MKAGENAPVDAGMGKTRNFFVVSDAGVMRVL